MPPCMLISLAPELFYRILAFCSRADLVALSQVNRVLQHSSEHVLYRDIFVSFVPPDLIKYKHDSTCELVEKKCLFRTLASSNPSSKTHLLRFLHIQFEYDSFRAYDPNKYNKLLLSTICSFLPHSPKLVDLRIMIDQHTPVNDYSDGDFSDALSASDIVPNLQTLYIDAMNDIPKIFEARTSLTVLGVYMSEVDCEVTTRMEDVYSILVRRRAAARIRVSPASSSPNLVQSSATVTKTSTQEPIVFLLETPEPIYKLSYLTFVPALYLPGSAEHVCRQAVKSLAQDLGKRYPTKCEDVVGLQLCLTNVCEDSGSDKINETDEHGSVGLERVKEMMEAIVKLFHRCAKFKIKTADHSMKAWRFSFFIPTISQLPNLSFLTFHLSLPDTPFAGDQTLLEAFIPMLTDLRSFVTEELVDKCPKLVIVVLISYEHNAIMKRENGWRAVIRDNDILGPEGWRGQPDVTDEEDDEENDEDGEGEEDGAEEGGEGGEEEEEEPDMVYISTAPPSFMGPPV